MKSIQLFHLSKLDIYQVLSLTSPFQTVIALACLSVDGWNISTLALKLLFFISVHELSFHQAPFTHSGLFFKKNKTTHRRLKRPKILRPCILKMRKPSETVPYCHDHHLCPPPPPRWEQIFSVYPKAAARRGRQQRFPPPQPRIDIRRKSTNTSGANTAQP